MQERRPLGGERRGSLLAGDERRELTPTRPTIQANARMVQRLDELGWSMWFGGIRA